MPEGKQSIAFITAEIGLSKKSKAVGKKNCSSSMDRFVGAGVEKSGLNACQVEIPTFFKVITIVVRVQLDQFHIHSRMSIKKASVTKVKKIAPTYNARPKLKSWYRLSLLITGRRPHLKKWCLVQQSQPVLTRRFLIVREGYVR